MEAGTRISVSPTGAPLQDAALARASGGAGPSIGCAVAGPCGSEAPHLTIEVVLWPTGAASAIEATNPGFVCVALVDGVELGRAVSFPLGPLALPSGRPDSQLTLRFVTSRPGEAYEGEVVLPLGKLLRLGAPKSSSLWLGLPSPHEDVTSLDLKQAVASTQNPEVPKVCLSIAMNGSASSGELPTIPEGPRLQEAEDDAEGSLDAAPGPACGSGHWARSGAPLLWRYDPGDGLGIKVRSGPRINATWTGATVLPGEVFEVSQECLHAGDSVRYLRLANGRGWLFDTKPGVGTMCVRQAASTAPLMDAPAVSSSHAVRLDPGSGHHSPHRRSTGAGGSPMRKGARSGTPCTPIAEGQPLEGEAPLLLPSSIHVKPKPKALCNTDWVRANRSAPPDWRQESPRRNSERMPDAHRASALCRTADFLRSSVASAPSSPLRKTQSLTMSATHQHKCVPVVHSLGTREDARRLDAGRSKSVQVTSTHEHDAVPVVADIAGLLGRREEPAPRKREPGRSQSVTVPSARQQQWRFSADALGGPAGERREQEEELNMMRSELIAAQASEMKGLFLRQDLQSQLLQLHRELDASRRSALEMQWKGGMQEEASTELRAREERQRQELKEARVELQEMSSLREKQSYLEDDIVRTGAELESCRRREQELQQQLCASTEELEKLRTAKEAQEYLQDDVLKVSAEVDVLKQRERLLMSELQDSDLSNEVLFLRQQLEEANAMAEQGAFLQDEVIGVSRQLDVSRMLEAQLQDQLSQAIAEVEDLRGSARQCHIQKQEVGTMAEPEHDREDELSRVREELLEAQRATEQLHIDLEMRQAARPDLVSIGTMTVPETPQQPRPSLDTELLGLRAELNQLRGKDRQSHEQLQNSRAQLSEVAEAAQARQQCLQDMLTRSQSELDEMHAKEDVQEHEDLFQARAELVVLRVQDRQREQELAQLRAELRASSEEQVQQQALLARARFEADEAQTQLQRQQHQQQQQRMEDEVGKLRSGRLGSVASETATTCSSECSKEAEDLSIQSTLEALRGSERQRDELQTQTARMAAELVMLRSRDLQREEKLYVMRREVEALREGSDDALQAMQAKLASAEIAKERMREGLLAELAAAREEVFQRSTNLPNSVSLELQKLLLHDAGPPDSENVLDRSLHADELSSALQDREVLRESLEEALRMKEDLEKELLDAREQLSEELVDKHRATAILYGELAAMRSELAAAQGAGTQDRPPLVPDLRDRAPPLATRPLAMRHMV